MNYRILISLSCILQVTSASAEWEQLQPLPAPNGGFACGVVDGNIIVVGGTNWVDGEKQWLDAIHRFDPKTRKWQSSSKLLQPFAYGLATATESPDRLILLGGSDGSAARKSIVAIDVAASKTFPMAELPSETVLAAGGLFADQFIVVGGTNDAANIEGMTRRAFALSLATHTVTDLPDYPGRPFGIAASVALDNELFIFGGANWQADTKTVTNTTECYAYSVGKKQWRQLQSSPLDLRGHAAVVLDARRIYIAGGYGGDPAGFLAKAFIYDRRADTFTEAKPLPYAATAGLVIHDGYLYCVGGEDQMKSRTDSFWRIRVDEL